MITHSDEFYYLLGLLWADGTVRQAYNEVSIEFVEEDFEQIKDTFIGWRVYKRQRNNWKPVVKVYISNHPFKQLLLLLDYYDKSAVSPTKVLKYVPKTKHYLFFRGYFDGDGCVYFNTKVKRALFQVEFGGSYEQDWGALKSLCDRLYIKYTIRLEKRANGHKYSQFRICSGDGVKKFLQFIYKYNSHIGFDRKRDKAEECLNALDTYYYESSTRRYRNGNDGQHKNKENVVHLTDFHIVARL